MRINRELMGCDVTRGGGMYSTAEFAKRMAALITVFVTDLVAATFLFLQLKGGKWRWFKIWRGLTREVGRFSPRGA